MSAVITSANYKLLFAILGKCAKMNDLAAAEITTDSGNGAVVIDQVADQNVLELDDIFSNVSDPAVSPLVTGNTAKQYFWKQKAIAYLESDNVYAMFASGAPASQTYGDVLTALIAAMTADAETLTTLSSTGIVHFLNLLTGTTLALPQASPGTRPDSTYCVATLVVTP